jgi:hypothetical protein
MRFRSFLLLCTLWGVGLAETAAACDRECLHGVITTYLNALV